MNEKSIQKTNLIFVLAIILIGGFIFSSCVNTITISKNPSGLTKEYTFENLAKSKDLKALQFKSAEEVFEFLNRNSNQDYYAYPYLRNMESSFSMDSLASDSSMVLSQASVAKGESLDYSETNVQVTGIDEGDILKTDGNYIYTISKNILYIIKAYPGEDAKVISTIKFNNSPAGLFIYEDNLAVFGNIGRNDPFIRSIDAYIPNQQFSFFELYDIADRSAPVLTAEYKFEGNYFNSRMSQGYIYFLTTTYPSYRRDYPIPIYYEGMTPKQVDVSNLYYYPIPYDNPIFVTISSLNIAKPDNQIKSKSFLVEGSQNIYMSQENIYITYTKYINEYELKQDLTIELFKDKLTDKQKTYIEKVKATDNDVLTLYEKRYKILNVYNDYFNSLDPDKQEEIEDMLEEEIKKKLQDFEAFEFTVINKISVEKGEITPSANNKVAGSIINQFSMDEYNEVFRIATTLSPRWSSYDTSRKVSTNQIYTLDKNLKILDKLDGLAEDERIYSTRFIADKLYMVTFKQIDPFFVIDLSDPFEIKELGQLKIPGFSNYLHPYDESTIIGIGKDATQTGRIKGLKISLFDVSDVSQPKEIASYLSEERYSDSTALYEHKAFLFSREKNLLVIPGYNYNYEKTSENYNGALVYNISKDSITLRGLIDHSTGANRYLGAGVERSLYIEDLLYTKSLNLLRINSLEDLSSVKNISLQHTPENIKIYWKYVFFNNFIF